MKQRLLTGLIGLVFLLAGFMAFTALTLPNVKRALEEGIHPTRGSQVLANDGQTVIMAQGKYYHKPLPLSDIAPIMVDSLIATEDRRYYQHMGIDPIGILRAMVVNVLRRGVHEGGSTLTQQLAKNVFLSNERTLTRKVKEVLLALKLENQLSKQQILELYLNNIYFGEGAYGIGAASQVFFGVRASQLTTDQAALLAGMPQAPSRYNPFDNPELAMKRRNEVLWNLVETRKITREQYQRYSHRHIVLNPNGRDLAASNQAPFFNQLVVKQAEEILGVDEQAFWQQGVKIVTTLDIDAQREAMRQVNAKLSAAGLTRRVNQASLVSLSREGQILAYTGGKDFMTSQFDIASLSKRQAGSLFKVFVYTTALMQGMKPQVVYNDSPVKIGNWEPQNYDKSHHGYMTLAKALAVSNNVVAAKVARDVGIENVVSTAYQMGINSQFDTTPSVALGAVAVNLQEMTTAFSVLMNDGYYVEPYAIEKIVDRNGEVLYQHMPRKHKVLNKVVRDTMVRMMQGVVRLGTGQAAKLSRFAVAGKTGTSDEYRDAWFIGFTPDVITGVWVGNEDNTKTGGIAGGGIPARIWRGFMGTAVSKLPTSTFDLSEALPMSDTDFYSYNLANLAPTDKNSPVVQTTTRLEDAFEDVEGPVTPPVDNVEGIGVPATGTAPTPMTEPMPQGNADTTVMPTPDPSVPQ